jgi:uncharacterized protein
LQKGNFMPVQLTYPGVYIQEVSSGVSLISGVATSVALFIGMSQNGPLGTPVEVLSYSDYDRIFGSDISSGEMPDQVRQFFLNGGSTAWIMRIAHGALASQVTIQNEYSDVDVLTLIAKNAGAIGDTLRIVIDYNTPTPEMTFNLTVYNEAIGSDGRLTQANTETYKNLTMDPAGAGYVVNVLRDQSALLSASVPALTGSALPFKGYVLGGIPAADVFTAIQGAITAISSSNTTGQFAISVDGSAFQIVTLTLPGTPTQATINAALTAALAPIGKSASMQDIAFGISSRKVACFTSTTAAAGGSVRIQRAPGSKDIAAALGWTADTGALEIGGHSNARPAPNGFVTSIGNPLTDPPPLLSALLDAPKGNPQLHFTDTTLGASFTTAAINFGTATDPMWADAASKNSLIAFQQNLAQVAAALNANFALTSPQQFSAEVAGLRLRMNMLAGNADEGANVTIAPTAGAAQLAATMAGRGNVAAYRPSTGSSPSTFVDVALTSTGNDGTSPALIDYTAAFETATSNIDIFNIITLPRAATQNDSDRADLWGPASSFAKDRRAFLVVDPPAAWKTPANARDGMPGARIGLMKDYAAIYWPRVQIPDPVTGIQRFIDPAGTVAGCYARTDAARGVWKAPAGLDNAAAGVRGLERRVSDGENGMLNPLALNVLRAFTDGIILWGARTMDGYDNSGDNDFRYVPVRRTALYIEESLYRGLKWAVFEPNDDRLWARIRLSAGAFMNTMFRQGAFQGLTKDTAYFVKCDSSTTTQSDIALGVVNVIVGFAPLRPAEFVVVTVTQMAGQIQS